MGLYGGRRLLLMREVTARAPASALIYTALLHRFGMFAIAMPEDGKRGTKAVWRIAALLLAVSFCLSHNAFAQLGSTTKTVLILYDGGREFPAIQLMDRSIESELNAAFANRVTIFREHMDLTRVGPTNYEPLLRDFYRSKYANNLPDLIVTVRPRPLDFVLREGDELFTSAPIVSTGMDARQITARALPPRVTGLVNDIKYWPTIELALALQPQTNHVVIVCGSSPNDDALRALIRDELGQHQRRVKFTFLTGLSLAGLLQRVGSLPPRTIVLFASFTKDADGRSFFPNSLLAEVARTANAPTYINSEDVLDSGAVGGSLISFTAWGSETGKLATRILNGERADAIPFVTFASRTSTVDARQLERWNIGLTQVPAGTIVLNRVPSVWETYRWPIVGGSLLLATLGSLITMWLLNRKRRLMAEQRLRVSEAERRTAVSEERNRMARDMHDTLAQGFTGVIVQLQAAEHALAHGSHPDLHTHMRRASELARRSLGDARRSIRALRSRALEEGNLCIALETATKQAAAETKLVAEFATLGKPRLLQEAVEENLLRIHQELLTNVLRHSGASTVTATLSFDANAISLEVRDDGHGFDSSIVTEGLGLIGIRERTGQMGGALTIESQDGIGTRVRVSIPHQAESERV